MELKDFLAFAKPRIKDGFELHIDFKRPTNFQHAYRQLLAVQLAHKEILQAEVIKNVKKICMSQFCLNAFQQLSKKAGVHIPLIRGLHYDFEANFEDFKEMDGVALPYEIVN